jgi:hypothetical protein
MGVQPKPRDIGCPEPALNHARLLVGRRVEHPL